MVREQLSVFVTCTGPKAQSVGYVYLVFGHKIFFLIEPNGVIAEEKRRQRIKKTRCSAICLYVLAGVATVYPQLSIAQRCVAVNVF